MQSIREHKTSLLLASLFFVGSVIYGLLNHSVETIHYLQTSWDKSIPFVPAFAIIYHSWYPFILWLSYRVFQKNEILFQRLMVHLLIAQYLALITFSLFQTEVVRMPVEGSDIFSRLVHLTYQLDNPYNGFPSIHVIASLIVPWHYNRVIKEPVKGVMVWLYAGLIIASTVLIRQHELLDALGGLIYSLIAAVVAYLILPLLRRLKERYE